MTLNEAYASLDDDDTPPQVVDVAMALINFIRWNDHGNEELSPHDTVHELLETVRTSLGEDFILGTFASRGL